MLFWNFIFIALFARVGPLLFDDIPEVKEYIPIHGSSISRVSMASFQEVPSPLTRARVPG